MGNPLLSLPLLGPARLDCPNLFRFPKSCLLWGIWALLFMGLPLALLFTRGTRLPRSSCPTLGSLCLSLMGFVEAIYSWIPVMSTIMDRISNPKMRVPITITQVLMDPPVPKKVNSV